MTDLDKDNKPNLEMVDGLITILNTIGYKVDRVTYYNEDNPTEAVLSVQYTFEDDTDEDSK